MLLPGLAAPGIIVLKLLPRLGRLWHDAPGARVEARRIVVGTVRDWLPLVLVAAVFDNLENYTGVIRKLPIDGWLYRVDVAVFGVEPTVWIQKLYHPLLTDWMATCYGIFFVVPMALAIALCLRGRSADFRELATAVMLQMWMASSSSSAFPPVRRATTSRYVTARSRADPVAHRHQRLAAGHVGHLQSAARALGVPVAALLVRLMTLIYAWRFGDGIFRAQRAPVLLAGAARRALALLLHRLPAPSLDPRLRGGLDAGLTACTLAPFCRRNWPTLRPALVSTT